MRQASSASCLHNAIWLRCCARASCPPVSMQSFNRVLQSSVAMQGCNLVFQSSRCLLVTTITQPLFPTLSCLLSASVSCMPAPCLLRDTHTLSLSLSLCLFFSLSFSRAHSLSLWFSLCMSLSDCWRLMEYGVCK